MRRLSFLTPLVACAACIINPPVVLPVDTTTSVDQTYDCALRSLNEMQYTITAADRSSGFVRARRLRSHLFGSEADYNQLTVSVYRADDGHTMLRVVPATTAGRDDSTGATDDGMKDQTKLVARCSGKNPGP